MEQQLRSFDGQGNMIRTGRSCIGEAGVVSAGRAEAAAIGRDILAQGGNAIDAAVATAFALGVCEPNASGLGGGGFMLLRDGKTGKSVFLDFRETAPQAAAPDMYTPKAPGSNVDIRERNVYGGMSAATPGEVAGLFYALEHYGTMTPAQVIAPAAKLAREGYVVTPMLHGDMEAHKDHLRQYGAGWKIYLKDGEPFAVGDTVKNPDLADTLDKLAAGGKDAFYKGEIAEKMLAAVQSDGGVLSQADLDGFSVRVLEPVRGTYRGYEILSSPPPSSGGTHVIEILNVLENFDVASLEVNSPEYLHLFSEACKLCYADRAKYMGDPKFVKVPLTGLLSKDYAR
ncbi:MAG: gamma-glutamyltransferase, partial [Clostridia bacterium]|nr:gamma-glutamyltransferase [Clostridia bacterium]